MKKIALILMLALPSINALALNIPKEGEYDYRVRFVDYNPIDVVKLVAHFGYQIDVVLQEGEVVLPKGVFMGDSEAWQMGTIGNHIFLKPQAEGGKTNMTVLTNRRTYSFDLYSHWIKAGKKMSEDMYYQVNFRYPQDEASKFANSTVMAAAARTQAEQRARLEANLAQKNQAKNWNYQVQGSESLSPDAAFDDGRFTYLTFKGNRDIPAIFIVNEDGSESLVNRHIEGDNVIIQSLAPKFVLRKGNSVACVFNDSYDPTGNDNKNGTTLNGVVRVIKGEPQ